MLLTPLLLHTCCAPCSAAIIEWLLANDARPTLFFFNPNIYPFEEYERRKAECVRYASSLGLEMIDHDYNHDIWLSHITGFEDEAERGKRCLICYMIRLLTTDKVASGHGFGHIATTLASSRWKDLKQITEAGQWAASQVDNVTWLDRNWRKDGLSERRRALIKENGFYNQTYCGCEFSLRPQKSD
ncbi:MAG: epoxyqueuosine reductase QueH [Tannerellaceae bacterium]|jgi:predicted adenine nucleotide alpha hydrolase (AANH) superfamily ATPase|nr:epoxyqueuosine reductase QueH [Tannerellaceae bacterium]